MKQRLIYRPYVVFAVLTVLTIAVLTGGGLLVVGKLNQQVAHRTAARDVLDQGRLIAAHLAAQPMVSARTADRAAWHAFSRQIHALAAIETGLQYVSVSHGNVVVFHEQIRVDTPPPLPPGIPRPPTAEAISMRPTRLQSGTNTLPVVVFSADFLSPRHAPRHLEIGIHRDTLSAREGAADEAVSSMFKLSLIAIVISFGTCSLLLGWAGRREWKRIERRRAEEHLAFSGVLANGIVHDFRNPMSSMRLDIQMLERETAKAAEMDQSKVVRLAGRVRSTMDRLDKVFQEFLYISKPTNDQRAPLHLRTCVADCVNMLEARFNQAGVAVKIDIPESIHVLVYEASLRRALVNVLINAEQFAPRESQLEVTAEATPRGADLIIRDHGPGIAPDMRDQLFDMFATARPGGTGLGLFLARAAVERSAGRIDVASSGPQGTAILIHLPHADAPQQDTPS